MVFRKLYIKWLEWRGKAVEIWSKNPYPANVLSNLYANHFCIDDIECASMEGFLQSLKYVNVEKQRDVCAMSGKDAKNMTNSDWQIGQIIWWKGTAINRQSNEYQDLIRSAYKAMFEQNERFRIALMSTRGMKLYHSRGERNPYKTILTESEFCSILTELRDRNSINK